MIVHQTMRERAEIPEMPIKTTQLALKGLSEQGRLVSQVGRKMKRVVREGRAPQWTAQLEGDELSPAIEPSPSTSFRCPSSNRNKCVFFFAIHPRNPLHARVTGRISSEVAVMFLESAELKKSALDAALFFGCAYVSRVNEPASFPQRTRERDREVLENSRCQRPRSVTENSCGQSSP
jgi:hypothetical protein